MSSRATWHSAGSGSQRLEQPVRWLKGTLPESALRPLRIARHFYREQRLRWGWKLFGSLRRLRPVRPLFGWGAGLVVDRYYIERFLQEHAADVHGRVLEVQDRTYTTRFGGTRVTRSDVVHVTDGNPDATIVADLTTADERTIPSDTFDCIIITQTLEFIYDCRAATATLHRILKPGGVALATVGGIRGISTYDAERWGDYWRFTSMSARRLFTEVFPSDLLTIRSHGNVLAASAFLHGIIADELRPHELDFQDPNYEVVVTVRAVKPGLPPSA